MKLSKAIKRDRKIGRRNCKKPVLVPEKEPHEKENTKRRKREKKLKDVFKEDLVMIGALKSDKAFPLLANIKD